MYRNPGLAREGGGDKRRECGGNASQNLKTGDESNLSRCEVELNTSNSGLELGLYWVKEVEAVVVDRYYIIMFCVVVRAAGRIP